MSPERWLPVPGWPGYEVSSLGRVRSVDRVLSDGRRGGSVMLRQRRDRKGYWVVDLHCHHCGNGRRSTRVHVLVAAAFIGPRPNGKQVRHFDGDQENNRAANLRYGTQSQNEKDKKRTRGRNNSNRGINRGTGSRAPLKGDSAVEPIDHLVTLAEAITSGLVRGTIKSLRTIRHRDPAFPEPAGQRGLASLYDPAHLAEWQANRIGPGGDRYTVSP